MVFLLNSVKIFIGIFFVCAAQFVYSDNVAQGAVATASSVYTPLNRLPSYAIDDDRVTFWSSTTQGSESAPQWLEVDLGANYKLSEIVLYGHDTDRYDATYSNIYNLYVSTSVDENGDVIWGDVVHSGELFDGPDYYDEIAMCDREVRFIKYEVIGGKHWAFLNELRAVVDSQTSN